MTKAYMIIDLQYGSTGKGLLAGYMAERLKPDTVATAWGPNAGHTYISSTGRKFIHRMLANGIVSPNLKTVLIGPGSVIDVECLIQEVISCRDIMKGKNIVIHPQAAIVKQEHREAEKFNVKIGSTMKGTGAAVIQRIMRDPDDTNIAESSFPQYAKTQLASYGVDVQISSHLYRFSMEKAKVLQIEGAQGFSLSIYHGFYPYCTSRDVTPAQVMADCAVPWSIKPTIMGTLRTFPIRVADRYDKDGNKIGTSGPCYPDQEEISWESIGLKPELTTVTQLPRRIFTFSMDQLRDAMHHCSPDVLFLNFCNYLSHDEIADLTHKIFLVIGKRVDILGMGPSHDDVHLQVDDLARL